MKNLVLLLLIFTVSFGEVVEIVSSQNQALNSQEQIILADTTSSIPIFNISSTSGLFVGTLNTNFPQTSPIPIFNISTLPFFRRRPRPRPIPKIPIRINPQDVIVDQKALDNVTKEQWQRYKQTYGKNYGTTINYQNGGSTSAYTTNSISGSSSTQRIAPSSERVTGEEDLYRFKLYAQQKKQILQHNARSDVRFQKGINKFSDKSQQQYVATYLGTKLQENLRVTTKQEILRQDQQEQLSSTFKSVNAVSAVNGFSTMNSVQGGRVMRPGTSDFGRGAQSENILRVDWRQKDVFNNFHLNQGECGSCYIFASIVGIQTHLKIKKGIDTVLSDQQILDCCSEKDGFDCDGCKVGSLASVYKYSTRFGFMPYQGYPYTGVQGTCRYNRSSAIKYLDQTKPYKVYSPGLDYMFTRLRLQKFPLTALVDATNWASYKKGIFDNCTYPPFLNHGAVIAGYQPLGGEQSAWIVKNSFGTDWGENGYIKLFIYSDCGINQNIVQPNFVPKSSL